MLRPRRPTPAASLRASLARGGSGGLNGAVVRCAAGGDGGGAGVAWAVLARRGEPAVATRRLPPPARRAVASCVRRFSTISDSSAPSEPSPAPKATAAAPPAVAEAESAPSARPAVDEADRAAVVAPAPQAPTSDARSVPAPFPPEALHGDATGVDEAGSDAVLGPVVIAAVVLTRSQAERLWGLGMNEPLSSLAPRRRDYLAETIKDCCLAWKTIQVEPEEINDLMDINGLSMEQILSIKTLHLLQSFRSKRFGTLLLDAFDRTPTAWRVPFEKHFPDARIVCDVSMRAHPKNISVCAGHLVARSQRDKALEHIARVYKHEVGSGYLRDFKTREYLRVFLPRGRDQHPVNIIRYHGWDRKILKDWRSVEKYRWKQQLEDYLRENPFMKNDPLRGTGAFAKDAAAAPTTSSSSPKAPPQRQPPQEPRARREPRPGQSARKAGWSAHPLSEATLTGVGGDDSAS